MSDPPSHDHDELVEELSENLIAYVGDDVSIEGFQDRIEKFPAETVEEAILESGILCFMLCFRNVNLDLVTYLVDLAPTSSVR